MFRAELELTDFMDTKSVTGYKLCKWLTITVRGNGWPILNSSSNTSEDEEMMILTCRALPSAHSCRWTWSTAAASCWHRPRDPGAKAVFVTLFHFRCYFRFNTWEVVCAELLRDGHRYFVPKISSVSNLKLSGITNLFDSVFTCPISFLHYLKKRK